MSNTKEYNDVNTGIIGKNSYKEKDNHPDIRGRINIDGIWYWLSGWEKTSNGQTFHSLAATIMTQEQVDKMLAKRAAKQAPQQAAQQRQQPQQQAPAQQQQQTPPAGHPASEPADFDDDIPF